MPAEALRPVTPIGIAAAELGGALEELNRAVIELPSGVLDRLRRAHAIVAGLDPYVEACTTPESPALAALVAATRAEDWESRSATAAAPLEAEMLSGHVEGQLLKALVHATGAVHVLEIGMFTGYSALAMAEALPDGGRVVACELDPDVAAIAQRAFAASAARARIEVRVGPAAATLAALREEGARFDLVFIDADKAGYAGYLEAVLAGDLLAPRGLICVDNTLLQGQPWTGTAPGSPGDAIARFNADVAADRRVEQVLLPVRDGVTLIRAAQPGS